jgi:flagellar export protein FliJ
MLEMFEIGHESGVIGEDKTMRSREKLVRRKQLQVVARRCKVTQIEGMIAEFDRMGIDLEREIKTEENRAGIQDPNHFAYPLYAKVAKQRRDNLKRSADELKIQLEQAKAVLGEAYEQLRKVELLEERDQKGEAIAEEVGLAVKFEAVA